MHGNERSVLMKKKNYRSRLLSALLMIAVVITVIPAGGASVAEAAPKSGKMYYISNNNTLMAHDFGTMSEKTIKKLPVGKKADPDHWEFVVKIGKRIYLNRDSFDKWKQWLYVYNTGTKKLKMVRSNCNVRSIYGDYFVADRYYRTDVSPVPIDLYKATAKGVRKIKTLSKRGMSGEFINKRIYYTVYSKDMKTCSLYRCKPNGKGKKKLGTFKTNDKYGMVYVNEITPTYCKVFKNEKTYKYTYKTRKLARI